jgi:pyruvate formate lyase activating enzyme
MIFDLQRFSTHDGPGIRTVVFFKGCSLRCAWCANPESQDFAPEILHNSLRCIDCHACLDASFGGLLQPVEGGGVRVDRSRSASAGPVEACPSLALRLAGREMRAEEIVAEVLKDAPFFGKSGGGATLSGGEPLSSPRLALEVARSLLAAGVRVAIETCLAFGADALAPFLGLPLLWLADLKHVDARRFAAGTGGELGPVLANLATLAASGAELELRIPVVPGFNADDSSMGAILAFAAALPNPGGLPRRLDFLPYHELALGKYAMLDRDYPWPRSPGPDRRDLERWSARARDLGFTTSTGG